MEKIENKDKKIGVSLKAVLLRADGKFLTLRRSETAPSRALGWDLPGGELDFGEDPETGIIREIREETGLEINNLKIFDAVSSVTERGEFWTTICYTAEPKTEDIVLSYEHDDSKWVTPDEFLSLSGLSPRQRKSIEKLKKQF